MSVTVQTALWSRLVGHGNYITYAKSEHNGLINDGTDDILCPILCPQPRPLRL